MINAYSRRKDGSTHLSADFTVQEFACKDGSDPVFIDTELVALLQGHPCVYGARLTGAGFGGACVALVRGAVAGGVGPSRCGRRLGV